MRAVFLDRDGVINRAVVREGRPYPPASRAELEIVPGARESLQFLKGMGFLLIVVTNQPDVARGTRTMAQVAEVHAALRAALPLDDVLVCPHDDRDGCACRKPKPGLLFDASARHGITMEGSWLIGDRWRDIDAGAAAGCRTILIDAGYRERGPSAEPDARVHSLAEAAEWIRTHDRA